MSKYLMQARSSVSGNLVTWVATGTPDWAAASFPGPGTAQDICAADLGTTLSQLPDAPHRMPMDSNTLLRWKFEESASPYVNDGTLGAAQNMIAASGDGTVYKGGEPDGLFGRGLKFSMSSTGTGRLAAASNAWPTPTITVSVWFTPTRLVGAGNVGQMFWKAANVSFLTPFNTMSMENDLTRRYDYVKDNTGGSAIVLNEVFHNPQGLVLNKPHLYVMTFGGGFLRSYNDGQLVKSLATAQVMDLKTGPWCIGTFNVTNQHAGGIYHEVRVCSVARDAAWVLENWRRGRGMYVP